MPNPTKSLLFSALSSIAFLLAAGPAHADLITNGSFETGTNPPGINGGSTLSIGSTAITGWTVINNDGSNTNNGNNLLWIGNGGYGLSSPYGTEFIDLTGTSDTTPFDGVSQTLATTLDQAYVLTFSLGVQPANSNFKGPITVDVSTGGSPTVFTDSGISGTTTADGTVWTTETLDFTAASTSTTLSIIGESGIQFIGVDNVSVNSASGTPEPGTGLLLLGAFPLAFLIRKRAQAR